MCAGADFKLKTIKYGEVDVDYTGGYYGGSFTIDGKNKKDYIIEFNNEDKKLNKKSRLKMIKNFTKAELVNIIEDIVWFSEEG